MNRGWNTGTRAGGYTIVETLIFLAVSAAMFVSAAAMISSRQGKVQFTNAVRNFESQLIDIANDVGTGYYDTPSQNFICNASASGPSLGSAGGQKQGEHDGCIFVGRVVAFAQGPAESYDVYTMFGLRLNPASPGGNDDVSAFDQTKAQIDEGYGLKKTVSLDNGVTVTCVKATSSGSCTGSTDPGAIGFVSRLKGISSGGQGSGVSADLYVPIGVNLGSDFATILKPAVPTMSATSNPIVICLKSGSSNQSALITIGGTVLSIKSEIRQGPSC